MTPGLELLEADGDEWDGWRVPQVWASPSTSALALPQPAVTGYEYEVADQPVLVEVWVEKSTMNDILEPLCRRLGVNMTSDAKGYESITHVVEMLRRAEAYPTRRAVVLYVSDNDHSGENMPVAVARQCQFWATKLKSDGKLNAGTEVFVHPIVLTDEQVSEYKLPLSPEGKTELDALEALRPGVLARIVEDEVKRWRDPDLEGALADTETDAQEQASQAWEEETSGLASELAVIRTDAEAIIAEYQPAINELNRRLREGPGQRLASLAQRTRETADADWDLPDRPEPEDPEIPEDILYDSSRHWLDQLQAYRAHKGQPLLELPEDYDR